jgi:hypothetical protein
MASTDPVLQRCLQQLCIAFDAAIAKTVEATGQLAMSALKAARRDELLLTQGPAAATAVGQRPPV